MHIAMQSKMNQCSLCSKTALGKNDARQLTNSNNFAWEAAWLFCEHREKIGKKEQITLTLLAASRSFHQKS